MDPADPKPVVRDVGGPPSRPSGRSTSSHLNTAIGAALRDSYASGYYMAVEDVFRAMMGGDESLIAWVESLRREA